MSKNIPGKKWPQKRTNYTLNPFTDNFQEFKQTRPAKNSDFHHLVEVAAARLGLNRQFKGIKVCQAARHILAELLPQNSQSFQVISFQDGILKISASSAPAKQALFMKQHQLLEQLSAKTSETVIQVKITH